MYHSQIKRAFFTNYSTTLRNMSDIDDILHSVTQGSLSEDNDIEILYLLCVFGQFEKGKQSRIAKRIFNRLDWAKHVNFIRDEHREFESRYHMSEDAFTILCDIIRPMKTIRYLCLPFG